VHLLPPFLVHGEGAELPETARAADEVLSLPVHPALAEADLARIAESVRSFDRGGPR
jgi:dTDP-4-amino-4,6-dideoxygalactose transaminase